MIQKWAIATTVTAATVLGALAAPAGAISLGFLESSGGTLETADRIFSDFFCDISTDLVGTNTPASCDDIDVSILPVGSGNGLKFTGNFFAAEGSFFDARIEYTATTKDPSKPLTNIGLGFDGQTTNPDGFATIVETVTVPNTGETLGQLTVFAPGDLSDPSFEPDDIPFSRPVLQARFEKDILLVNGASITMITQPSETSVPEPATGAALLALGSLGIGSILKRNHQNKA
ncbi:MAG TPA: hypothetical protein DD379_26280 [Cyanobacteria bacterium UBA11162]|nr:hypothetical protein [Cyanobacteria bacterium UBA11162]